MQKQPSGSKSGTDWEARFNCNRQPEVKVLDTWHTLGMRGTGSRTVKVEP